ncbi:hypothetical protein Q7P35_006936 [Cladosporium inversicolor]
MSDSPNQHHVGHVDAVNLTVSLCLCYTICIALVRLWTRRGAFGVDDLVVLVATVVTLSHTGSSYAALADGLGKPWEDIKASKDLAKLNAASIAGVVTFTVSLYISKIGVLAFLSRITKNRTQVLGYYACCALVATFGVMSVLIVIVGCYSPSGYYWAFYENSARCDSQSVRWQVLTALDIITELGLLALPLQLVWGLQMPWTKKTVLLFAFYLRLPVIGLSLGRNAYTLRLRHASSDAGLDSAIVTIWLEVQLAYALAASTLSALKAFTESFETGFGLGFTRGKSENGSYALSDMSGSGNGTTTTSHSNKNPEHHQQHNPLLHSPHNPLRNHNPSQASPLPSLQTLLNTTPAPPPRPHHYQRYINRCSNSHSVSNIRNRRRALVSPSQSQCRQQQLYK